MRYSKVVRFRRLTKEALWIAIGQIATVLGSLLLVRVLTEHLDPTQYGELALALTVAGLVSQVVMGGVTAGIGRFYAIAFGKGDLQSYFIASRVLLGHATLVVGAIGMLLSIGLVWLGYSRWLGLTAAALLFSVISAYNVSLSGIQNAARQRAVVAFHGGLNSWLKILLVLVVFLSLGNSSVAVLIGFMLSLLFVTGSQILFIRRLIPQECTHAEDSISWARQMWTYAWPFSAWGIFTWLQLSSDRWALEAYTTTNEVGLYYVLYQLGYTPISMAAGFLVSFLGPILYQRSGDASDPKRNAAVDMLTWRITLITLLITVIGFALAVILHRGIFALFVAKEYQFVSYLLPWMVLAGGFFASGQILALKLMTDMKPRAMTSAKIGTALLGVLLNIYLASVAGLKGIVGSLVVFSAVYLVWLACIAFRKPAVMSK